jgi:translation initiation factor IF-3
MLHMAKKPFYQTNQFIKAEELRVVDDQAAQLGVMSKWDAIKLAQEADKDLVLVAPTANPPVAKIISFSKFKYQQQQKDATSRKKANSVDIKEIRFTPFIAENDFVNRIQKAREFLEDGNKVKLNVKFTGRQITHREFGDRVLNRAMDELSDLATVEREPAFQGKVLFTQLQPMKKK